VNIDITKNLFNNEKFDDLFSRLNNQKTLNEDSINNKNNNNINNNNNCFDSFNSTNNNISNDSSFFSSSNNIPKICINCNAASGYIKTDCWKCGLPLD
jgi:ribosomal protein L40E